MELHLGLMTNKELSQWFGISEGGFRATKAKKLQELEKFARFEEYKGKVKILEIYIPQYMKISETVEMIKDEFTNNWSPNGLDSCSRVSLAIEEKIGEKSHLTPGTIYNYTRKTRNELYGVPYCERGTLGSCKYVWCKKKGDGVTAQYEFLTAEEEKIKNDLLKVYFGNTTEKQIMVKEMVDSGEITKDKAWDVLEKVTGMNNFYVFLKALEDKIGNKIVRGTLIEKDNQVFLKENDEFLLKDE